MGRPSKLTDKQWDEIKRRHFVGGESVNSLAKEFGITEGAVRQKIKLVSTNIHEPKKPLEPLSDIAKQKIEADNAQKRISEKISLLSYSDQNIVSQIASNLQAVSEHLSSAAKSGAKIADRLMYIANQQLEQVDDANPEAEESTRALLRIETLRKIAKGSAEIGLELMRANREAVDEINHKALQADRQSQRADFGKDPIEAAKRYQEIMGNS